MLALALALSLAAPTTTEDYNRVRQDGNNIGLGVLGAWGLASAVSGGVGLLLTKDPRWQGAHAGNVVWGLINIGFSVVGLYLGLKPGATRPDRADALADGRNTQNAYVINTAIDVGYLALAAMLLAGVDDVRLKGVAQCSLVQALWLTFFDGAMAMFHALNNDRLRSP